ncbi:MAG: DUF4430 domain-containing protein [Lachnospiraceae bacterium]|nr:DUF4430 domain-containing protein [Lachnospiraceae bacterium]
MAENAKKSNKKVVIGAVVLVAVIAVFAIIYAVFGAKTVEGSKEITITVINQEKEAVTYELQTDAEVLKEAMDEAKEQGLTYSGSDGQYGFAVDTVNGVTADFNTSSSYWSFYVNDTYCNYGISSQPVVDGDAFKIVYEVYVAE